MRPQGHCNTDHMERDLNIVVHVQHYENMDTRTPINNLQGGCPSGNGHLEGYAKGTEGSLGATGKSLIQFVIL
ncbi:hypothetical protein ACRRTK_006265 [Alexandromys fortis]